jgi:peptidoglycan/LPS O-acetylase OafA/YrhL
MTPLRHHGLDGARALAMMFVLSGHAMVSFTVTPVGWAIQDRAQFLGVDLYAWVVRAFAMPTFFWLAGYFGRALLDGAGLRAFLRNRVTRILVPLAVMLVPVSYALTGPVAGAIGPETTLIAAGILGSILMFGLIFVPGVRDPERDPAMVPLSAKPAEP